MELVVVVLAQKYQVVQVGGSSIGPMSDVVGVEPPGALAVGEPASAVSTAKLGQQPRGNHPGRPADPDDRSVVAVDGEANAGVAAETPERVVADDHVAPAGAVAAVDEIVDRGVDDHGRSFGWAVGDPGGAELRERVGAAGFEGNPFSGRVLGGRPGRAGVRAGAVVRGATVLSQIGTGAVFVCGGGLRAFGGFARLSSGFRHGGECLGDDESCGCVELALDMAEPVVSEPPFDVATPVGALGGMALHASCRLAGRPELWDGIGLPVVNEGRFVGVGELGEGEEIAEVLKAERPVPEGVGQQGSVGELGRNDGVLASKLGSFAVPEGDPVAQRGGSVAFPHVATLYLGGGAEHGVLGVSDGGNLTVVVRRQLVIAERDDVGNVVHT